ncbi:hypothetical protein H8B09_21745 [Paenibacillus sp. PR3]|uniref:Uncharacterized protein n=1 Tax=Paenibacillus terricola TaxID=2763503 RepID=A0ABR8MZU0_9BACL|nr:hypothetical protein [Paenibacillus terricola]MBD3921408.1 hypothetical protein [Paenibacillus terricola]
MRAILMTVLLLLTVILIYEQVVKGEDGTNNQLEQSGSHIRDSIQRMSP